MTSTSVQRGLLDQAHALHELDRQRGAELIVLDIFSMTLTVVEGKRNVIRD